jgi:hypothetical protein
MHRPALACGVRLADDVLNLVRALVQRFSASARRRSAYPDSGADVEETGRSVIAVWRRQAAADVSRSSASSQLRSQLKARRTNAPFAVGTSPCAITTRSIGQARTVSSDLRAERRLRKLARQSLGAPGFGSTIPPCRARNPRHPLNQLRGKFWIRSANGAVPLPR